MIQVINTLNLPRYGLVNYVAATLYKPPMTAEAKQLQDLSRAGKRLVGSCRTNLFKRLESSGEAFQQPIERHILLNRIFLSKIEIKINMRYWQEYDLIYLSPHLDDVALSCGGQIAVMAEKGVRILVVTIAAADPVEGSVSPLAETAHRIWGLPIDPMAHRRAEDATAFLVLGADFLHLDFQDALYRVGSARRCFYCKKEDLFGTPDAEDMRLMSRPLVDLLCQLPSAAQVVAPLAVGNHVDHWLTRIAAEEAFPRKLLFFEDFPYVFKPHNLPSGAGSTRNMDPLIFKLSRVAESKKLRAVSAYSSQIPLLFGSSRAMRTVLRDYHGQVGGERCWISSSQSVTETFHTMRRKIRRGEL